MKNINMQQRAVELIGMSNSEDGMVELRWDYIRGEEGSKEFSLAELLGASASQMIESILRKEYPLTM